MKNLRHQLLFSITALLLAIPATAQQNTANVRLTDTIPDVGNQFIYAVMAADSQSGTTLGRLAVDLVLENFDASPVEIDRVELQFVVPAWAKTLDTSLKMICPWPWSSGNSSVLTPAQGLILAPGQKCRLGLLEDPTFSLPASARLGMEVYFKNVTQPLVVPERDLVAYTNTTPLGSYRFPAHAEELADGEYWTGHTATSFGAHRFNGDPTELYAYDLGVRRFDSNLNAWVSYTTAPGASALDSNDDYLVWDRKVYAMAGGTVVACDNTQPDDGSGGYNYIDISNGTERAHYSHFQPNNFCVLNADVAAGDLLGRVGSSGALAPHLHVDITLNLDPVPLNFNDTFRIDRSLAVFTNPFAGNAPWAEMGGTTISFLDAAIWPSGLRRRGDASDVGITTTSLVNTSTLRSMTASRTTAGNLRVSLWNTDSAGDAVLLDTDTGAGVSKVSLAVPLLTTDAALAMVTSAGTLKIAAYDVIGNTITRTTDFTVNPATDVAAVPANFSRGIATAVQTQTNGLKVIAWTVDPANASIVRKGDDVGLGTIQQVAAARTATFPGIVTAVLTAANRLRLSTFKITSSGAVVTRIDDVDDALASQVSIAKLGTRANGDDLVVTAIRTLAGDLELVSWSIDAAGNITRLSDFQAGAISEVSTARATSEHVLTGIRDSGGNFKLIAWYVDANGDFVRRADSLGGAATQIRQEGARASSISNPQMAVSAMADNTGTLKLIVHEVLLHD